METLQLALDFRNGSSVFCNNQESTCLNKAQNSSASAVSCFMRMRTWLSSFWFVERSQGSQCACETSQVLTAEAKCFKYCVDHPHPLTSKVKTTTRQTQVQAEFGLWYIILSSLIWSAVIWIYFVPIKTCWGLVPNVTLLKGTGTFKRWLGH